MMSLRASFVITAASFCLVALVTAAMLILSTRSLLSATRDIAENTRGAELANELEVKLLSYQRISNFSMAVRGPEYTTLRNQIHDELRHLMMLSRGRVDSNTKHAQVERVCELIEAYISNREATEMTGLDLGTVLVRMRPRMEAALAAIEQLRALYVQSMEQSMASATQISRVAQWGGISAGIMVLLGGVAFVVVSRRSVYRPILSVVAAVQRFHQGDTDARADENAPKELSQLAHAFNQLATQLVRQQQRQLEFLAGVAHDIRTPLLTLTLSLEMLAQNLASDSAAAQKLSVGQRQLGRINRMLADLLEATRIESGHLELRLEHCDLRGVAQEVVDLYGPVSTSHELSLSLPRLPVMVNADPTRIGQVLNNLVSNAIKYSPEHGPIEMSIDQVGGRAILCISDRGVGIDQGELDDIFVPFRRPGQSRASVPGTGLGLSVVRRIVLAHGGQIEVLSTPGKGSTFRVYLPSVTQ